MNLLGDFELKGRLCKHWLIFEYKTWRERRRSTKTVDRKEKRVL